MRIAIVADSHLAPDAHAFNRNWSAMREFIGSIGADLTVHLGDITVDGLGEPAHFRHALALTADWPTPIRYVPGNHDIGDHPPAPGIAAKQPLETARLRDFRAAFGPDYWVLDTDGWRVIAMNAQLPGTGTGEEAEQWSWLVARVAEARDKPVVLMLHKPLFQESLLDEKPHHRYLPAVPRAQLLEIMSDVALQAVITGHTHQYRDRVVTGVPRSRRHPRALAERTGTVGRRRLCGPRLRRIVRSPPSSRGPRCPATPEAPAASPPNTSAREHKRDSQDPHPPPVTPLRRPRAARRRGARYRLGPPRGGSTGGDLHLIDSPPVRRRVLMQERLWPSREESAAANLRRAIYDAKGDFVVEWIERGSAGYFVLFRKGNRVHREPQIDIAVLEDGPDPDAIHKLVHKLKTVFEQR